MRHFHICIEPISFTADLLQGLACATGYFALPEVKGFAEFSPAYAILDINVRRNPLIQATALRVNVICDRHGRLDLHPRHLLSRGDRFLFACSHDMPDRIGERALATLSPHSRSIDIIPSMAERHYRWNAIIPPGQRGRRYRSM